MRPPWNEYFMILAKIASTRSTCNSRPIGCVIVKDRQVISTGYNGAAPGENHCIDHPPLKNGEPYCFRRAQKVPEYKKQQFCVSSHAEKNAIALAARKGISVQGATAYLTLAPCFDCIKMMAVAGINEVYYEFKYESKDKLRDKFWGEQGKKLFKTFKQLEVPDYVLEQVFNLLKHPTSIRRLAEPLL